MVAHWLRKWEIVHNLVLPHGSILVCYQSTGALLCEGEDIDLYPLWGPFGGDKYDRFLLDLIVIVSIYLEHVVHGRKDGCAVVFEWAL